jgi:hypothetical protein
MDLLDDFAQFSRWARFDALAWLRQHNWDWDEAMVAYMGNSATDVSTVAGGDRAPSRGPSAEHAEYLVSNRQRVST